jgi:glycosyltransferase involved in cell wall biosynthesis
MESVSVIVPVHNNAEVVGRTLASVEDALTFFREQGARYRDVRAEVVVVDDGSTDDTLRAVRAAAAGKDLYRVVARAEPSSPAHARNTGVAASSGTLLFFLDGDDLFLPDHVFECYRNFEAPDFAFAKGRVATDDPVHPDWRRRIDHSVVINLCVRRWCHDFIGGFPDRHLTVRDGDAFRSEFDVFFKIEDMYYNELVTGLFPGVQIQRATVRHLRYPGNTFDRQYEKFRRPFGSYREQMPTEYRLRLALADVLIHHHLETLQARLRDCPGRPWVTAHAPPVAAATAAAP